MTSTGTPPEDPTPADQPTTEIPAASAAPAAPAAQALPSPAAEAQPTRVRAAWLRLLTPLPAGVLAVVLVLAGFGLGVVVGWHHDNNPRIERAGFGPGQHGFGRQDGPQQRQFGDGQGFGRQGQQGPQRQQGQQGPQRQQGQQVQPNQPAPQQSARPTPSVTS
jgi:hypothetical protein